MSDNRKVTKTFSMNPEAFSTLENIAGRERRSESNCLGELVEFWARLEAAISSYDVDAKNDPWICVASYEDGDQEWQSFGECPEAAVAELAWLIRELKKGFVRAFRDDENEGEE